MPRKKKDPFDAIHKKIDDSLVRHMNKNFIPVLTIFFLTPEGDLRSTALASAVCDVKKFKKVAMRMQKIAYRAINRYGRYIKTGKKNKKKPPRWTVPESSEN